MKFRPCIDLHEGRVKQIVGGTLSSSGTVENFVSDKDAAYYADMYKEDNLFGGHVIMLGPGNDKEARKALRAFPGGLQIGGGITPENACSYLDDGASHVIVTSYVFNNGMIDFKNLDKISSTVGKDRLVVDLSCRRREGRYFVVTDRWQNFTDYDLTAENFRALEEYCNEFLVHAAHVEGMKSGIDGELVKILAEKTDIPVTYAGGVGGLSDIQSVYETGEGRIDLTIGSALDIFGGTISYREVVARPEFSKKD